MNNEPQSMSPKDWEGLKAVALHKVIEEQGDDFVTQEPEAAALLMRFYLLGFKGGSPAILFKDIDF